MPPTLTPPTEAPAPDLGRRIYNALERYYDNQQPRTPHRKVHRCDTCQSPLTPAKGLFSWSGEAMAYLPLMQCTTCRPEA